VRAVRAFFLSDFTYSTYLQSQNVITNTSPLASFLLEHRTGHCEYFATATVHLLRAAGIPARYAVGYSVQEKKRRNEWIVRSRHAHAWALAWIDGQWQEVDNTPANWNSIEATNASFLEPFTDWISDQWFAFNRWRQGDSQLRFYIFGGGVLMLGYLAWRQVSGKRWRRSRNAGIDGAGIDRPGLDSDFYLIEKKLAAKVAARQEAEPVTRWIERIQVREPGLAGRLSQLVALHYRHRFDPAGLTPNERKRLKDGVRDWLEDYEQLLQSGPYKN
jgi:hypothetical protein